MPKSRASTAVEHGRLGAQPLSTLSYMEDMEVTREDHFTNVDETSTASRNSLKSGNSSGSRLKKSRFAHMLRPKHGQRATSTTSTSSPPPSSRGRSYSGAAAEPTPSSPSGAAAGAATATATAAASSSGPRTPERKNTRRLRPRSGSQTQKRQQIYPSMASPSRDYDNFSILSDNNTVEGLRSVATYQTISSVETVKASNQQKPALPLVQEEENKVIAISNKTPPRANSASESKNNSSSSSSNTNTTKSAWKRFKSAWKPFRASSSSQEEKKNSTSDDASVASKKSSRRRVQSFDKVSSAVGASSTPIPATPELQRAKSGDGQHLRHTSNRPTSAQRAQLAALDQSVRGRFDGLDVMTLGSAAWVNAAGSPNNRGDEKPELPWLDTRYSVVGQSTHYSPAELVKDTLWTSGGRVKPEMILEGYLPGPEDRWSVQIESTENPKYAFTYALENIGGPPALQKLSADENTTSTSTDDLDSPLMSSHKLWASLWGSDPVPSGQPNRDLLTQVAKEGQPKTPITNAVEDPLLSLAAHSSIPIDIDEDTFIVSTRDHLMAVQRISAVCLSEGRFDTALRIFEKLLLGLSPNVIDERKYLRGATYHNIGLIHLWQGNYSEANAAFGEALKERRRHMTNHMDLVVTQCRKAQSLFALERFDQSIALLEACLKMSSEEMVIRAKMLNNLAIVHYHKQEMSKALRYLARALEQQRGWLDGPIRREPIVYDASVSLSNMGKVYLVQKDFELCSAVYEEALLLQTSIFQKDHPVVMQAYVNLAWSKALSGHARTGLRLLESCLRVQTQHYGADASATVETAGWMAHLYARAGRYEDALTLYQRIRQWQKQHLKASTSMFSISGSYSSTHPSVRLVKDCIKQIEKEIAPKTSLTSWL